MRIRSLFLFFIVVVFVSCESVSDPESAINKLETTSYYTSEETSLIFDALSFYPNVTQLSLAIIDSSGTHYYGAERSNDSLITIENHKSIFEIGSITKVFTSSLLAHQVIESDLDPDTTVRSVLNFELKDSVDFTFKQLANHTSGLPRVPGGFIWNAIFNADNPYKSFDEEKLRTYLSEEVEAEYEAGSDHSYSNLGAGFLGYVLEQTAGQTYEELLKEYIFMPLNMTSSTTQRENISDQLVKGVDSRGGEATNWDLASLVAAGGIYSSTEDMVRYAMAQLDTTNNVYKYQKEPTYTISEDQQIALGWYIISREDGSAIYWHNGGTGGYRSSMALNPVNGTAVVVLSNISAGHAKSSLIDRLCFDLLRLADGLRPLDQKNNSDS